MAHFAKLGINGKIIGVHVVNDSDMLDADGNEDEVVGQQYLERHSNWPAQMWIQTSYNTSQGTHKLGGTPFRGNYAAVGMVWDEDNNMFYAKKPYSSWVLNTTTATWHSPSGDAPTLTVEQEAASSRYEWNEDTKSWDLITS